MRKISQAKEMRLLKRLHANDELGQTASESACASASEENPVPSKETSQMDDRGKTYIIAGLGNPGAEYSLTRHNAGFKTLEIIADEVGASYWKSECGCVTSHVEWHGYDLILAEPQSFMNNSGGPLSRLMDKYDVPIDHVIVIHDELDIDSGTIRVKAGGGHGGHNGLRSIIDKTGSRDFSRVRIGIGRPPGRMPVVDYVLSAPRSDAAEEFDAAAEVGAEAVLYLIENGMVKTQDKYNRTSSR